MEKVAAGMVLYHGSYATIREIRLSECIAGKDFGKGFYLTSSFEQAKSFVKLSVKRNRALGRIPLTRDYGFVNVYELVAVDNISDYYFEAANLEWLHFVAGNRDNTIFREEIRKMGRYNVIAGKIANDRTAATLQAYIDGVNGNPGDAQVDRNTIAALLPNRLEDQYCFRDQDAVNALGFVKSERVIINV